MILIDFNDAYDITSSTVYHHVTDLLCQILCELIYENNSSALAMMVLTNAALCTVYASYTGVTDGLPGDKSQLRASLVLACVFSAGQLQCNLTSTHLESFTNSRDPQGATILTYRKPVPHEIDRHYGVRLCTGHRFQY